MPIFRDYTFQVVLANQLEQALAVPNDVVYEEGIL